ncbi:MAG: helix-hairpin-helix domain-containing protein [Propionibacteriaceae bacterium]|jgi:competence ComEA-like helix-hairpin-helix protein|nr:helix-hairpin-helix domain-containing protein [Propionibacteriaceae bacterium]
MATWRDGPEYAPLERPDILTVPDAAPLTAQPWQPAPGLDAPIERPAFTPVQGAVPQLASITSVGPPARDPRQAFTLVALATGEPRGAAAPWTPDQPLHTSGPVTAYIPPAQTVPQTATINPPSALPAYPPPAPPSRNTITLRKVVNGITAPVLICLGVGVFVWPLAPLMYLTSFLLSARIQHNAHAVRVTYGTAGLLLGLIAMTDLLDGTRLASMWNNLSGFAAHACWMTLVALVIIVYLALSQPAPKARGYLKVPLNRASVAQLAALRAVGPVLANRIVDWRRTHGPFTSLEQLRNVPGVGPKTYAELVKQVEL